MLGIYLMGGFPECQHILKQHLVYIVVLTTYVGANQRLLFTIQKVITIYYSVGRLVFLTRLKKVPCLLTHDVTILRNRHRVHSCQ